jgi:hypothetical protein
LLHRVRQIQAHVYTRFSRVRRRYFSLRWKQNPILKENPALKSSFNHFTCYAILKLGANNELRDSFSDPKRTRAPLCGDTRVPLLAHHTLPPLDNRAPLSSHHRFTLQSRFERKDPLEASFHGGDSWPTFATQKGQCVVWCVGV